MTASQDPMARGHNDGAGMAIADQLVVFRLMTEEFGIPIHHVKEIVRLPEITPIPGSPDYVSGICNLRGSVLPVMDTRKRLSLEEETITETARLLVVDFHSTLTGLIVDGVREVLRVSNSQLEKPPKACTSVDENFLAGVLKMENGQRLILIMDLTELLFFKHVSGRTDTQQNAHLSVDSKKDRIEEQTLDETQFVSFRLAADEYAFDISKVREIIKLPEITPVPNVPSWVKGIITIRDALLPLISLRNLLGLPTLLDEHLEVLDAEVAEEQNRLDQLVNAIQAGIPISGSDFTRQTQLGKWLDTLKTTSTEVDVAIKHLKNARAQLLNFCLSLINQSKTDKQKAQSDGVQSAPALSQLFQKQADALKKNLIQYLSEDERAIVVEVGDQAVGFIVDGVNEVLRVPKSQIHPPPFLTASRRKELKGVAKLDAGQRLIMLLDETALIAAGATEIFKQMESSDAETSEVDQTGPSAGGHGDEIQLVCFTIDGQEFGVPIANVQEINRIPEITVVPEAPDVVDGITNLRGSVIPVVNIRTLFGIPKTEITERTRIIIVDIAGNKTGLRVDQVNEVLRVSAQDVEPPPRVATLAGTNPYLTGVCKLDQAQRIIMILGLDQIVNKQVVKALADAGGGRDEPSEEPVGQEDASLSMAPDPSPPRKKRKKKSSKKSASKSEKKG